MKTTVSVQGAGCAVALCLALTALLAAGCASPGIFTSVGAPSGSPPHQNAQSISVSVSPASFSIQAGQTQNFIATVQNDAQNKGVTWALSGSGCSGAGCGIVSGNSSASGAFITYTAPATVPNPATVTLTATSVTDTTKSAASTITVSAPPPPVSVSISPVTLSIQAGQTQSFTASVQNDPQNKGVTWALSGAGCSGAACGTLSGTSPTSTTYTAPATVPSPATVTLTATSVTDTSKSAAATITVTAAPPPVTVSISPARLSMQAGQTQSFTATVQNDAQNKGVTWTLSGPGCSGAACGALSGTSPTSVTYTAPATVPSPATVTLTATSVTDSTKSAAATITVTAAPPPVSVSISPVSLSIQTSQTQTFTATVQNDPQNKGVTWTLSGAGCTGAACGTLSGTTLTSATYTAPATVPSPATVTLTATSVTDTTKNAAATITVTAAPPPVSVSISPASLSIQTSQTQTFTATVQNDPQNRGVNWTLSGAGCTGAACGTLSNTSATSTTYTAPATVPNPATVTLTATAVADTTKTATASITITAPAAVSVSVTPASQSVVTGQTQTFTATVQNDPQNKGVTWTLSGAGCSGTACGTLSTTSSSSGTAVNYTAPGTVPNPPTVTLTATSVADPTKSSTANITVTTATSNVSVTISPKRGGLTLSQTLNFAATVQNDVTNQGVKWTASGGTFTTSTSTSAVYKAPNSAGVYTITATSIADGTKSASAVIGVTNLSGVTTYHNDLSRDGVNSQEYALTTSNVNSATFGKVFSCAVDGPIYPQPLWVPNLSIPNKGIHNVIFVATENDSVYAFDADTTPCLQYWQHPFVSSTSGEVAPTDTDLGQTDDFYTTIGIVGTPVIDLSTQTMYLVTKTETKGSSCDSTPSACHQRLHALDIATGNETDVVEISSSTSVPGTGDGSANGQLPFSPLRENQRPGLALVGNRVVVSWGSHSDYSPWHGWIMAFDKSNLTAPPVVFNATPNGSGGGIWMAGGAPAVDANNNLYVITGNGDWDGNTEFGDSMLKLDASLSLQDWLTPFDQSYLDTHNEDFGAGGATILVDLPSGAPFPHLLIGGGKVNSNYQGLLYVVNRDSMGHLESSTSAVVQKFPVGASIYATGAFWQNTLYIAAGFEGSTGTPLQAYTLNPSTSQFNTTPSSSSTAIYPERGATPAVSSRGSANGIVWAIDASQFGGPSSVGTGPALLHAYDATNLNNELWNSGQVSRDQAGNAVKFTVPTIANGKVYIGTTSELDVYGLLPY